jgi:hypothetical protein
MEIGLYFLTSDLSPDFKIGVSELSFHMDGNILSFNELLKISQRDMERKYLRLKRKVPGIPSGSIDLTFFNLSRPDSISASLIW